MGDSSIAGSKGRNLKKRLPLVEKLSMSRRGIITVEEMGKNKVVNSRPLDEVTEIFGLLSMFRVAIGRKVEFGAPLIRPRRVLISYRWGSQQTEEWIKHVARIFWSMGYIVVHDR